MRLPTIRGVIDRRILLNYRVDPRVLKAILPSPFRPQVVHEYGITGICLIRLCEIRPKCVPRWIGLSSENAAHRIAVEWEHESASQSGVYILRRDTNLRLNVLAGGRLFPGVHHHARFRVQESGSHVQVAMRSDDGQVSMSVDAKISGTWPSDSLFPSLEEASEFFKAGSVGYSPASNPTHFEGLELRCQSWQVQPLTVRSALSSLYDDSKLFPRGTIMLDNALLMRGIEHEWHSQEDLCCQTIHSPLTTHDSLSPTA
jgi:hypothetical protein